MNRFTMPTVAALAVAALALTACSGTSATATPTTTTTQASSTATSGQASSSAAGTQSSSATDGSKVGALTGDLGSGVTDFLADNVESHADSNDGDQDSATATAITLGSQDVNITEPGTYLLSGTLSDASVIVNSTAEGKVVLILDGVTMTASQQPPVIITAADEVVLVLADGSTNTITDTSPVASETVEDAPDAAIFSMADLTIAGSGSLTVSSTNNDGIASKDGLVVLSGDLTVDAGDDAIRGKDYLIIQQGTLNLTAAQDGLKSSNEDDDTVGFVYLMGGTVNIDAGDDAVHAEGDLLVSDGALNVNSAVEGLEGANIVIAGGESTVVTSDDAINATSGTGTTTGGGPGGEVSDGSQLVITGGTLNVDAQGDGLDSNGTITMTGGTVVVAGPTNDGNGAIDATGFDISGGLLIAAGSAGMAVAPDTSSSQGWVAISQNLSTGQTLEVSDSSSVLASYVATKPAASIIVSAPGISNGSSYQVSVNGASTSTVQAGVAPAGMGPGGMGGRR